MRPLHTLLLAVLLSFLTINCSDNEELVPEVITDDVVATDDGPTEEADLEALVLTDVSYGDDPLQVYDIYLPAGRKATRTKTIILIHGGGWVEGDKEDVTAFLDLVQSQHPDHAVVNMNYVLADPPSVPAFPNQFLDVQAVVDQLDDTHEELSFLNEYGFIGLSAGAHLAMMYDYTYDTQDQIKFVANIVGPADFTDPFYADEPGFEQYLDALTDESAYPANTNLAEALSPAIVANVDSSPTLQFYGNEDPLVPLTNGQRLDTALSNNNVPHIFTVYDGGHGNWDETSYLDVRTKIGQYIDLYLAIEE